MNNSIKILLTAVLLASMQAGAYSLAQIRAVYSYASGMPTTVQEDAAHILQSATAQGLHDSINNAMQSRELATIAYGNVKAAINYTNIAAALQSKSRAISAAAEQVRQAEQEAIAVQAAQRQQAEQLKQELAAIKEHAGKLASKLDAARQGLKENKDLSVRATNLADDALQQVEQLEQELAAASQAQVSAAANKQITQLQQKISSLKRKAIRLQRAAGDLKKNAQKVEASSEGLLEDVTDLAAGDKTALASATKIEDQTEQVRIQNDATQAIGAAVVKGMQDIVATEQQVAITAQQTADVLPDEVAEQLEQTAGALQDASKKNADQASLLVQDESEQTATGKEIEGVVVEIAGSDKQPVANPALLKEIESFNATELKQQTTGSSYVKEQPKIAPGSKGGTLMETVKERSRSASL